MMRTPTPWSGVVITCLTVIYSTSTLATTGAPPRGKSTTDNSFLLNCDWLRRSGQFYEYDLKKCGDKGHTDAPASDSSETRDQQTNYLDNGNYDSGDMDKSTPAFDRLNYKKWNINTPPIREWPEFKDWDSWRTTRQPLNLPNIDWNKMYTDLDKWDKFTVPPLEETITILTPHMWDGENHNLSSTSMFGTTGVVIGLGALIVLAMALSLGVVYCCRVKQHQRRVRRQRLFLITARADSDDYEQFRHDMETTPPCVGLRVECPPSYEDALHHSNSPPEIVVEATQAQEDVASPPPYSAVIEASCPSPNYSDVYVTEVDTQTDRGDASDLDQLQTPDVASSTELSSTSRLVFKDDKELV